MRPKGSLLLSYVRENGRGRLARNCPKRPLNLKTLILTKCDFLNFDSEEDTAKQYASFRKEVHTDSYTKHALSMPEAVAHIAAAYVAFSIF